MATAPVLQLEDHADAGPQCGGAEGVIAVRRIGVIVALGALLGMLGGLVTASPALARGPKWEIVPADPFILPGDTFCGFDVGVSLPVSKEYSKLLKTPEGVVATLTTGALTASLTNLGTGKTITENISGPLKTTFPADGSLVVAFKGLTLFALEPAQAKQFGLPILSVTAGALTTSFDKDGNPISISLNGHVQVDICAALS